MKKIGKHVNTTKTYIPLLLLALALVFCVGTVSAVDYTVNPGGSIQDVITAAADDDQITVNDDNGTPYTYTENIVIDKRLTIKSNGTVSVNPTDDGLPVFRINSGGSGTTIDGFIISGVTDTTSFGAIHLNDASNCKIVGNTIYDNWGGIRLVDSDNNQIYQNTVTNNRYGIRLVSGSTDNQIYENTVMDNTLYGISFTSTSLSGNTVSFNRIVGNVGNGVDSDGSSSTINAENNWWGSNTGPGGIGSDTISSYVDANPWLVLKIDANPTNIGEGETSTITADLTHNSDDVDTSASGNLMDGTPVLFTTDLGNVGSNSITKYTENGKATATLTADEGTGTAHVSAQVDNYVTSPPADVNIAPSTVYVNVLTGDDTYDGEAPVYDSTHGPKKTIQNGINTVAAGGTVYIAQGTYNEHDITISNSVNLHGENQATTIIDAETNARIFYISSGITVNMDHLTLTNGNEIVDGGGAIRNYGTLNLNYCTFTKNTASTRGGAIRNDGTLNVANSNFSENSAGFGGAIRNYASCTIVGSTFNSNSAGTSGGASYNDGTIVVTGSTFTGNSAGYGAALWNNFLHTMTVTGSTFTGNTATTQGGAFKNYGTLTANYNRFYNNNAPNGACIYTGGGSVNAENNWWGSNNPISNFPSLIYGAAAPTQWLYMTVTADPTSINNGETSQITVSFNNYSSDGTTYTPFTPVDSNHIPNGAPVTFNTDKGSIGSKTINKETIGGIATATLTADETAGVAHVNAVTDDETVYVDVTINPKSSLYLQITTNNDNPVVGDTVTYTLKVGNKGPDAAKDVVMTYTIPDGLEFASAKVDVGTWNYDPTTRTITWTIGDVPVGDPYMWLNLRILRAGQYTINPRLSTSTYDPTLNEDIQSITVNAVSGTTIVHGKTIGMQTTGMPIAAVILAVLILVGGMLYSKKEQ